MAWGQLRVPSSSSQRQLVFGFHDALQPLMRWGCQSKYVHIFRVFFLI